MKLSGSLTHAILNVIFLASLPMKIMIEWNSTWKHSFKPLLNVSKNCAEAHPGLPQTSEMESFAKMDYVF